MGEEMKTFDEAISFVANPKPEDKEEWDKYHCVLEEMSVHKSVASWCALKARQFGIETSADAQFDRFVLSHLETMYTGIVIGMEMEKQR